MSNPIRYDSLLVRYLAAELERRFGGRRLEALRLDPERRLFALEFGGEALIWDLHPTSGAVWIGAPPAVPAVVPLTRQTSIAGVRAPADERLLVFELRARRRSPGQVVRIVVELMGNQWNLLALDDDERMIAALWRRTAGGRTLRPGGRYAPPAPAGRLGAEEPLSREEWRALLGPVEPAERRRRLVERVAYTSPINGGAILGAAAGGGGSGGSRVAGDSERSEGPARSGGSGESVQSGESTEFGGSGESERSEGSARSGMTGEFGESAHDSESSDPTALDAAYERYAALVAFPPAEPQVLDLASGRQAYPLPLPGVAGTPAPTLLDAIVAAAGVRDVHPYDASVPAPAVAPELLARLRRRVQRVDGRISRLRAKLDGARPEAAALRRQADLLLSQLHQVRKGMDAAELSDFAGGTITVTLDPALDPKANARRLYESAKKRERAAERLPSLIGRAEGLRSRLEVLLARAEAGAADRAEIEAELGAGPQEHGGAAREAESLPPFRRYRTSGGLEVRVGRNRRANDALTFHNSSPNDVWLHAREVAGSHVILRWADAEGNPPARDLHEAAVLAALHSKARTSGIVAVDWTRRKYVRKPRKAPPGLVVPERVKTVFVEPEEAVERRLRDGSG